MTFLLIIKASTLFINLVYCYAKCRSIGIKKSQKRSFYTIIDNNLMGKLVI